MRNYELVFIPKLSFNYAWQKMQSVFPNKTPKIHHSTFKSFSQLNEKWNKNELFGLIFIDDDNDGKTSNINQDLNSNYLNLLFSPHFQSLPNVVLIEYKKQYHVVNYEQTNIFNLLDFQNQIQKEGIECLGFVPQHLQEVLNNFENEQYSYGFNCVIYQFDDTWTDSEVHEYAILLKNIILNNK